eukprot:TRINITY_DN24610_c0_g1_i1.p1 TRINITY_DN24610_c0_g1~~TRINITY_DN24610_c0_g1_i1.p1  ORF type:complete len:134 (-),score=19.62 TRINITY_DN24610_c0_g1_i1:225-626(-)
MHGSKNGSRGERVEDARSEIEVSFSRLSPAELKEIKESLLNLVSAALIQQPKVSVKDPTIIRITKLAKKVAFYDPQFVLKLALYVRVDLNIRSTANYLLSVACNIKSVNPTLRNILERQFGCPAIGWMWQPRT